MKKRDELVVKRSLFWWVFAGDLRLQVLLIAVILVTVFVRVVPLEMQKRIINETIKLHQVKMLFVYCGVYLLAVVAAGGLKYLINVLQTTIGQQATMEMRRDLYDHILRLPLNFFKKTQPGMVVAALTNEVASAGDFIGQAIAVPITNILTLLALSLYLLWLNPLLAAASLIIYPAVLLVLPRLQKKANTANKQRIDKSRDLSNKIAETINGMQEIHAHGAHHVEALKFSQTVKDLQKIRVIWNLYRFGIKASTNFFNSLSPVFIFILGGYLALHGRLDLGAMVAFLSAQEKLFTPWKEMIDFYQDYQDASVSYYRTMDYFDALPEHRFDPENRPPFQLENRIEIDGLSCMTDDGIRLLDQINVVVKAGESLALVGHSGSGKSTLVHCIGQLVRYTGGSIRIGEHEVAELTKKDVAHNVGFVSQSPFIFNGTFQENLLYACRAENSPEAAAGVPAIPGLDDMIEVIQQTGIFSDVLRFGLNTILDSKTQGHLFPVFLRIRKKFQRLNAAEFGDVVEFFAKDRYLYYSSIAQNLTFGFAQQEAFREENLATNDYFRQFLHDSDLWRPLTDLGAEVCRRAVDIFGSILPDEFFLESAPFEPVEYNEIKQIAEHLKAVPPAELTAREQQKLLELALRFVPGRHKMVGVPAALTRQILRQRPLFKKKISADRPAAFTFFHKTVYLNSFSILNNIFFGRLKAANPQVEESINQRIIRLLIEEEILEKVLEIGMQFQVGSRGDRLSGGQRQKLAIARVLLKKPPVLILDEATSALDNKSQARIQGLLETHWKGRATMIAVAHRLDTVKNFDRIMVMKAGQVCESGTYTELMERRGLFYDLALGGRQK